MLCVVLRAFVTPLDNSTGISSDHFSVHSHVSCPSPFSFVGEWEIAAIAIAVEAVQQLVTRLPSSLQLVFPKRTLHSLHPKMM